MDEQSFRAIMADPWGDSRNVAHAGGSVTRRRRQARRGDPFRFFQTTVGAVMPTEADIRWLQRLLEEPDEPADPEPTPRQQAATEAAHAELRAATDRVRPVWPRKCERDYQTGHRG